MKCPHCGGPCPRPVYLIVPPEPGETRAGRAEPEALAFCRVECCGAWIVEWSTVPRVAPVLALAPRPEGS